MIKMDYSLGGTPNLHSLTGRGRLRPPGRVFFGIRPAIERAQRTPDER